MIYDHPMEPSPKQSSSLFLREDELKRGMELILRANRALADVLDSSLAEAELGHADYRALLLVGRHPGISISRLQRLLRIRKQSLARVLDHLQTQDLMRQEPDPADRRRRVLKLTDRGADLERMLFGALRARVADAYRRAGADAVGGFWKVLELLAEGTGLSGD